MLNSRDYIALSLVFFLILASHFHFTLPLLLFYFLFSHSLKTPRPPLSPSSIRTLDFVIPHFLFFPLLFVFLVSNTSAVPHSTAIPVPLLPPPSSFQHHYFLIFISSFLTPCPRLHFGLFGLFHIPLQY